MNNNFFERNLAALRESRQTTVAAWLLTHQNKVRPEVIYASDCWFMVVSGQSQASPRNPKLDAVKWCGALKEKAHQTNRLLFGASNPYAISELLNFGPLALYEPNPAVLLTLLTESDFSQVLNTRQLLLHSPWDMVETAQRGELLGGPGVTLLSHPPSQRREPGAFAALKRHLEGLKKLPNFPKIMVAPPLSGGSGPIAHSLALSSQSLGLTTQFLDWPLELKNLEQKIHQSGNDPKPTAELFELAGKWALSQIESFQPDLFLALAQCPIEAKVLVEIRTRSDAHLAFWLVEDFAAFSYPREILPHYDTVFHFQENLFPPISKDWGLADCHFLPMAADPKLFCPWPTTEPQFSAEVSFMGAPYPNRRLLFNWLIKSYWPKTGRPREGFRLFGSGWQHSELQGSPHLFANGRRLSQEECAQVYANTKINLNIHSGLKAEPLFCDRDFTNPRTFEIAACAGFQLVDKHPGLASFFTPGSEVVEICEPQDLPDLIDYYLQHPAEAAQIGQNARARVLAEHTYEHRLKTLLSILGRHHHLSEKR